MSELPELNQSPISAPPEGAVAPPRAASRSHRRRKWAMLLILLVAGGGWFGHFAYLRITLRPEPRTEYWEAKIAGLDPPPPGAISSSEAYDLLTKRPFETEFTSVGGQPWVYLLEEVMLGRWTLGRDDIAAAVTALRSASFQNARLAMRDAVRAGWEEPVNLKTAAYGQNLGNSYDAWATWLLAHSRWALMEPDYATAMEDWMTGLRLSRQSERQRTGPGIATTAVLRHGIGWQMTCAANEETLFPDTFALMQQMDEVLGPAPRASDIVAGERWVRYGFLDAIYVRRGSGWMDVSEATALVSQRRAPSRWWNLTSGVFRDYRTACAHIEQTFSGLERYRNASACLALPRAAEEADGILDCPYNWESPAESALRYYHSRAWLDGGLASLALHEYRRRHDSYPDALADLVPEVLPRVPIDYIDGQPLRYRPTSSGYLLYSIGENGLDDGGSDNEYTYGDKLDIVFSSLKRPGLR
jgi:hypothetical protein